MPCGKARRFGGSAVVAVGLALASVAVTAAGIPAAAHASQGAVWGAGNNYYGQLASDSFDSVGMFAPSSAPQLDEVTAVAAGGVSGYALRQDGTVLAWGRNDFGQLGDGTTKDTYTHGSNEPNTPVQVVGLSGVTAIAGGGTSGYAVREDGTVWSWGRNDFGQLGDGTTTERHTPVQVSGLSGITMIVAGSWTGYALRDDGTVWAWGHNAYGQLGDGTTASATVPVQVPGLSGVTAIAAGQWAGYAVRSDGTVWSWGANWHGQLGDGALYTNRTTPAAVTAAGGADLLAVTQVAGAGNSAYALRTDGTVVAWGRGDYGQMGDGTRTGSLVAKPVPDLASVTAIAAGTDSAYALLADGTVRGWGRSNYRQLGDFGLDDDYNNPKDRLSPIVIPGLAKTISVAAGGFSGFALVSAPAIRISTRTTALTTTTRFTEVTVTSTGQQPLDISSIDVSVDAQPLETPQPCTGTFVQGDSCTFSYTWTGALPPPGAFGGSATWITVHTNTPAGQERLIIPIVLPVDPYLVTH